ncbi:hypothetical protein [Aquabacterium sp.]|uniref:hypothetical protein n=1 Tax=Aquabacterium sp. TaxID=1872578 RepID=UPI003D062290
MKHTDWQGFYGPAYRLLLTQQSASDVDEMIWGEVLQLQERNPASEGHWEFLATGYLHLFDRRDQLPSEMAHRLTQLTSRFHKQPRTCNWRLMAQVVKARLCGRLLRLSDLAASRLVPAHTGFLPDEPGDSSSQYHAYMLLLVMRFGDPRDEGLRAVVERATRWLHDVHHQHGDPSPLGRGRFQIFGYAAMAALANLCERWNAPIDAVWHSAVWARSVPESPTGSMSAAWAGPHRTYLLHGYNTTDDYPAFAALWMNGICEPPPLPLGDSRDAAVSWWHPLDDSGSGLIANSSRQIAALLVDPHPRGATSVRHLATALLRRYRRTRSREYAPVRLDPFDTIRCGGFRLVRHDDRFVLNVDSDHLTSVLTTDSVTLWLPHSTEHSSLAGSCELEHLTWQRTNASNWYGMKVRVVRYGDFQVEWKF